MKFKKIFEDTKNRRYFRKDRSSFTIKMIDETYGSDKIKKEAAFKVYAVLFESSIENEGSKTSDLSTTIMDVEAFNTDLEEGKHITVKGDPAASGYSREILNVDFSEIVRKIKQLKIHEYKLMESSLPFKQSKINDNVYIREFSKDLDFDELKWHWDEEDRTFEILEGTGWKFQRDNELPIEMKPGDIITVKRNEFHRAIKPTCVNENLVIKLTKHERSVDEI